MAIAIEIAMIDPAGPITITAIVTPSACPVVPPGSGKLNIIRTNENAAKTEMRGTMRVVRVRLIRRRAPYQPRPAPTYRTAHVEGLRYPSGICMLWLGNFSRDCKRGYRGPRHCLLY